MKTLPLALAFAATALHGADTPLPDFNSSAIGIPPLSLSESAKLKTKPSTFASSLPTLDDLRNGGLLGANSRPALARIAPSPPRFAPQSGLWNMPVLQPNPAIDHRIVVKEPDPRVDFKMLIVPNRSDAPPAK